MRQTSADPMNSGSVCVGMIHTIAQCIAQRKCFAACHCGYIHTQSMHYLLHDAGDGCKINHMNAIAEHSAIPAWDVVDRLHKALREADMSVNEMALYLGVHRNTVSAWLNGRTHISGPALRAWAHRTGVNFHWLDTGIPPSDGDGSPRVANPTGPQPDGCRPTPTLQVINPRKRSRLPVNASTISPVITQRAVSCRRDNLRATG